MIRTVSTSGVATVDPQSESISQIAVWNSSSRTPRGISRNASYLPLASPPRSAGASARKCDQCAATRRRAVGTTVRQPCERLQHVVAGQLRLGDEHRDLAAAVDDPVRDGLGLLHGRGGEHVVVPRVAPELVGEVGGVLGSDQDDGGVHRSIVGGPGRWRPRPVHARPSGRILGMAIRPVVITGEPVLHRRAQPVEVIDDGIRELVADMFDTMDAARGVGLAAPQVGVGLRIFTWQLTNDDGIPPRGVVLNPYLTSAKPVVGEPDPHEEVEGCLSVPGESYPLRRGEAATLTGLALDGTEIRYEATGWFARMLQHEYDHLNGFLYVDRLSGKWARKARKAVKAEGWGVPGLSWMPGEDRDPFGHDDETPEDELSD